MTTGSGHSEAIADQIEILIRTVVLNMRHDDIGYALDVTWAKERLVEVLDGA